MLKWNDVDDSIDFVVTRGSWYNGFSPGERERNFRELKRQIASGELAIARGPCSLCSDPAAKQYEYHNEDYSLPLKVSAPCLFILCRNCHRYRLHKRFSDPLGWLIFIAHVRRGGYASDLKNASVVNELRAYRQALKNDADFELSALRPYSGSIGSEWFAKLRMDARSLNDPSARRVCEVQFP